MQENPFYADFAPKRSWSILPLSDRPVTVRNMLSACCRHSQALSVSACLRVLCELVCSQSVPCWCACCALPVGVQPESVRVRLRACLRSAVHTSISLRAVPALCPSCRKALTSACRACCLR